MFISFCIGAHSFDPFLPMTEGYSSHYIYIYIPLVNMRFTLDEYLVVNKLKLCNR